MLYEVLSKDLSDDGYVTTFKYAKIKRGNTKAAIEVVAKYSSINGGMFTCEYDDLCDVYTVYKDGEESYQLRCVDV